jgi:hypothetical protein
MDKVPCEDCVVFAICISLIGTYPYYDINALALNRDCSILNDYINPRYKSGADIVALNKARKLFGLKPVSRY